MLEYLNESLPNPLACSDRIGHYRVCQLSTLRAVTASGSNQTAGEVSIPRRAWH
jgi:hypothetical protein